MRLGEIVEGRIVARRHEVIIQEMVGTSIGLRPNVVDRHRVEVDLAGLQQVPSRVGREVRFDVLQQ